MRVYLGSDQKPTKTCSVCGLDKIVPDEFTRDSRDKDEV